MAAARCVACSLVHWVIFGWANKNEWGRQLISNPTSEDMKAASNGIVLLIIPLSNQRGIIRINPSLKPNAFTIHFSN